MCVQSSLYYQPWIDTWRSGFKQKTNSISSCLLNQETKITKILNILTSLYHIVHNTCITYGRNIKTRYFGLILILRFREGSTFYQTRSNAIILQGTLPALLYSKSCEIEDWRSLKREIILVSSTTTQDLTTTRSRLDKRNEQLGSTVEQQPVGKIVRQSFEEVQQRNILKTNPTKTQTNL